MSAAKQASGIDPTSEQMTFTDAPGQLRPAVAGLGVGILAGALARLQSESYGEQESSALRATAHATVPFFVAASMLADRVGPRAAVPFRSRFLGAHLVHMHQIARLLRDHGTTASGLLRYRRPLPIYACLATLLASGLASRKRSR